MAQATDRKVIENRRRWGAAPMPLLPSTIRDAMSASELPSSIRAVVGDTVCADALDRDYWDIYPGLSPACLKDLVKFVTPAMHEHAERPVAESAVAAVPLDSLALEGRTQKALAAVLGGGTIDLIAMTWRDLLDIPNVGPRRALEFACAVELAVLERRHSEQIDDGAGGQAQTGERTRSAEGPITDSGDKSAGPTAASDDAEQPPQQERHKAAERPDAIAIRPLPSEISTFFRVLAAWASGERGHSTLAAVLPESSASWPPELVQLWRRLCTCDADTICGPLKDRYSAPHLIERLFEGCDHRHRFVLQARLFTTSRPTALEALAKVFGLTVKETRELEVEAMRCIEPLDSSSYAPLRRRAEIIRHDLGSAIPERDSQLAITLNRALGDNDRSTALQFDKELLLWMAGPYRWDRGWLVNHPDIVQRSTKELMQRRNDSGLITDLRVHETLSKLQIRSAHHSAWIDRLGKFTRRAGGLCLSADARAA